MAPGHDRLGPPKKEGFGFTRRHLALWPFKHPITAQHVDELLRFASGFLAGDPDEVHTLLHLLYLLSPGISSTSLDLTMHGQQLRRAVVSPHDSYSLLARWRALPLALLEGRVELPDIPRVTLVKTRTLSLLRGLDVDSITLGFPLRKLPAVTLLITLRMIDLLRPPPPTDTLAWDHSKNGAVDYDMHLADAAERDDGPKLLTWIERYGFDARAEGRGALDVLHSALRWGNVGALRLLLLRYPHMHNAWVDFETGMAPVHYLAEGGGPTLGREKADAILPLLFPFSSTMAMDGGIWPAPRSLYFRDPTTAVGTTAVHLAVSHRSLGVLSALLAAGASVTVANRLGLTPLTLALCCRDYTAADAGARAMILEHYRQACVMLLEAGAVVPASLKAAKLGAFENGASADLFAFCKGYRQIRKSTLLSSMRLSPKQSRILTARGDFGSSVGIMETPEMEKAAMDIQRLIRGRLARLKMGPSSERHWRGDVSSPSCVAATSTRQKEWEEEAAALRIQKIVRGRSVRRRMGPKGRETSEILPASRRGSMAQPLNLKPGGNTTPPPEIQRPVTVGLQQRFESSERIVVKSRPTTRATSIPASRHGRARKLLDEPNSPYARENRRLERPQRLKQRREVVREDVGEETVIIPTVIYAGPPPRSPTQTGGFNLSYKGAGV